MTDVLSHYVDAGITSPEDAAEFARSHPDELLKQIERHKLFVAQDGPIGEPIVAALARYDANLATWRSQEWLDEYNTQEPVAKILNAVQERLAPQYNLLSHADTMKAHPLLCIEQQAHYFKVVSELNTSRLEQVGLLDRSTRALLAGLGSERLAWLSSVPIQDLARMRADNEHEAFRKRLATSLANLHDSALADVDRVAAELCREIDSGIAEYNKAVRQIESKYASRHGQTLAGAAVAGLGLLVPTLAPFVGPLLPMAVIAKAGWDAWEGFSDKREQSRSLMGVLAIARCASD